MYYTVPQVLSELKDQRAREHFERLALNAGVLIEVRSPEAAALAHGVCFVYSHGCHCEHNSPVIQHAKKTGDYAVLSHTDLCVVALTYALHTAKGEEEDNALNVEEVC
jgi:RNA-binding protein NOB1